MQVTGRYSFDRSICRAMGLFWFLLLAIASDSLAQPRYDGLFRSRETFISNNADFTKWTGMLQRFLDEQRALTPDTAESPEQSEKAGNPPEELAENPNLEFRRCPRLQRQQCRQALWQKFLADAGTDQNVEQLEAVNRFLNQTPYILDSINWGVEDYWETLGEFFRKDGDCEDYAISKYITLKKLGWPAEAMRIAVINDENLRIPHAVLVVAFQDKKFILDNQANAILTDDKIFHYRPVYSINETGWWRHLPQSFGRRFGR